MDTFVYDVEIANPIETIEGKWGNFEGMGFASAVVYSYDKDRYYFFLHLKGLTKLTEFLHKNRVITFNGIRFDSKIMLGKNRKIFSNKKLAGLFVAGKGTIWEEYDIFVQCLKSVFKLKNDIIAYKRISPGGLALNNIAKATINMEKSGNGANAPILYQQKKYDDLLSYNLQDVRLTRKLYDFIAENRFIYNKNRKDKIRIPYII